MILEEFNKVYKYKSDVEKYGFPEVWEIPELEEDGFIYGDCESYCRFLKNKVAEFKNWDYYYCKLNGEGHCILYKNGDVIDCNIKQVVTLEQYGLLYNPTDLIKYSWFVAASKILFSKGFLIWKRLSK